MDFFTGGTLELTMYDFLLQTLSALFYGVLVSAVYMYKHKHSKTMALTLVVLPALVQVIIMLVSGNIGAGVAVAGAFSLVRFRSATGSAKDIGFLFFAMVVGFITGMGFVVYALVFLIIVGCTFVILAHINFGQADANIRKLRIVIPENLDFQGLFDEVFAKHTKSAVMDKVKSTNMGSLYELTYTITLNEQANIKNFIDDLRTRNGNLNIFLSRELDDNYEL